MSNSTLLETVNKKYKPISQAITTLKAQVEFYLSQIENGPAGISIDDYAAYVRDIVEKLESLLREIEEIKDSYIIKIYQEKDLDSYEP